MENTTSEPYGCDTCPFGCAEFSDPNDRCDNCNEAAEDAAEVLQPGDLGVFCDYKGRNIACRVVRVWAAGEITREAQLEIFVVDNTHPYPYGAQFTVDASKVTKVVL